MITDIQEFCGGYFHVDECLEWKVEDTCLLEPGECTRRVVKGIVKVEDEDENILFVKKYSNEFRGHTEANLHVEDIMTTDPELNKLIKESDKFLIITLYIGYQPCHNSSGGRNMSKTHFHVKSCTNVVLNWYKSLPMNRIIFNIKCCGIYRAHWTEIDKYDSQSDAEIFYNRSLNARKGLRLLMSPFKINNFTYKLNVTGLNDEDWDFIMSLCSEEIKTKITSEDWKERKEYDVKVNNFLKNFK